MSTRLVVLLWAMLGAFTVAATSHLLPPRAMKLVQNTEHHNMVMEPDVDAVPMYNEMLDAGYYLKIEVGTPAKTERFRLGSEGEGFAISEPGPPKDGEDVIGYTGNHSSSFEIVNESGTADPETVFAKDVVTIGNKTYNDTLFEYHPNQGKNYIGGGHLGIAVPFNSSPNQDDFIGVMSPNWEDKQIGVFLSRHLEPPRNISWEERATYRTPTWKDSEVVFGGVNKTKITGEITYFSFVPYNISAWSVPLKGISVNGYYIDARTVVNTTSNTTATPAMPSHPTTTFPATSTSVLNSSFTGNGTRIPATVSLMRQAISGPLSVLKSIYGQIPGSNFTSMDSGFQWTIPCNTTGVDIRLHIGDKEYPIESPDIVIGLVKSYRGVTTTGGTESFTPPRIQKTVGPTGITGMCVGLFQPPDKGDAGEPDNWKIGTSFLKNVYTSFRLDPPAVGFAQLADNAQPDVEPEPEPKSASNHNSIPGLVGIACSVVVSFSVACQFV